MTAYKHFNQYVLRSPINPLNSLKHPNLSLDFFSNEPAFLQAIRLASPDLFKEFRKWEEHGIKLKKDEERLLFSMLKYYSRSCSRCTPFGLFAGFSVGSISSLETDITLKPCTEHKPHTRLDMNFLCALIQDLEKDQTVRSKLTYFVNNSLYESGEKIRYIEYTFFNTNRKHQITAAENNAYLDKVLTVAKEGSKREKLAQLLVDDEITIEDASNYIEQLINNQVLISELEPTVTGLELHDFINEKLSELDLESENTVTLLKDIKNEIQNLDRLSLGNGISKYDDITSLLSQQKTSFNEKFLYQTDLALSTETNQISSETLENLSKVLSLFNKYTTKPNETNLSKFRDAFYKRYEDRQVSLIHALDIEAGIGYIQNNAGTAGDNTPLVDNIDLPQNPNHSQSYQINWDRKQSLLLKKYIEAIKNDHPCIEITDSDLEGFVENWDDLPSTFSVMTEFIKIDNKDHIIVSNAGGSSAINLLGRFAHTNKNLDDYIKDIAQKEEELNPNKILAEIVHLPESRIGNILARPVFRKYEIPYLAQSSTLPEHQIPLEDIMVSVTQNRVIIKSKRLKKEIKPHLSNAHNFSNNALPAYQFLADLQYQGLRPGIGFNWGSLAQEFDFLPRVTYQNFIISEATWTITKKDIEKTLNLKDDLEILKAFKSLKELKKISDKVVLVDGDNELYIDLENITYIKMLLSTVKKRPSFTLKEFLFSEDALVKDTNDKAYTNQIVFAYYKEEEKND